MSDNFESYKKVAVEFHTLYLAFLSAGFSEEQALTFLIMYGKNNRIKRKNFKRAIRIINKECET